MKYNGRFKVKFIGDPFFHVNKDNGTVVCRLKGCVETPFRSVMGWLDDTSVPHVEMHFVNGFGIAKCHADDNFDENRGKRIALARAENSCYLQAVKYLNSQAYMLNSLMVGIEEFTDKAYGCCAHNDDYVDSLVNEKHPMYKKEVSTPKRGVVVTRK